MSVRHATSQVEFFGLNDEGDVLLVMSTWSRRKHKKVFSLQHGAIGQPLEETVSLRQVQHRNSGALHVEFDGGSLATFKGVDRDGRETSRAQLTIGTTVRQFAAPGLGDFVFAENTVEVRWPVSSA